MMIATVLLLINLAFLLFKDEALFSFWKFVWIYPLEIFVYLIIGGICVLIGNWWINK